MFFPHNASDQSISIFFNGGMKSIPASDPNFAALSEHLAGAEHDHALVENWIDKPAMITRMSEGLVSVVGSTVYYKGQPVHSTLAYRLIDVLDSGKNATTWARFMDRVMANPSERSRDNLYEFLDKFKAPITEDGHFIAFKRVRGDYLDQYTGSMDNSPGKIVEMPRHKVDDDPDVTCSYGLHVAATSYLGTFYSNMHGTKTLACKVDPADVVAVPRDYNSAKMRVCRYLVLGDAEESFYDTAQNHTVVNEQQAIVCDAVEEEEETVCADCLEHIPSHMYLCEDCQEDRDEAVDHFTDVAVESLTADDEDGYAYCGTCGDVPVDWEGEDCDDCEEYELNNWQQRVDDDHDRMEEEDHREETGLTRSGVPVEDLPDTHETEMAFSRNGATYTATAVKAGIAAQGQRGFSRTTGIPRTTLQDWVTKIEACE